MSDEELVDEAASALYRVLPQDFISARDERVRELRADGHRDAAKQVAAMRRPTVAAWLVNLLVQDDPELSEQIAALADELREAQERLAGPELRALGRQRQQLVSGLVGRVRKLAHQASGKKAPEDGLAEVESTLRAALADVDVAKEVLSGRLERTVEASGFGPVPSAAPARQQPKRKMKKDDEPEDEASQAARARVTQAEDDVTAAERARKAADDQAAAASTALASAEERVSALRNELASAEGELDEARRAAAEATSAAAAAADELSRADARLDDAQRAAADAG